MARRPILLFDVLDTLVYDPFYVEVPAFFGMSFQELIDAKHPTLWARFETGAIDQGTFLEGFFRDGRDYDHTGLMRCMREAYRWLDGMEALLSELNAAGYEIHALSNYSPWYRWIEERLGLSRFLSWSFVSCDTGVRKPDSRAFEGPPATLGVGVGECLLVDDRAPNCEAAHGCGLPAIRFEGAGRLRETLGRRLGPFRASGVD